jgi:hypothetical protein
MNRSIPDGGDINYSSLTPFSENVVNYIAGFLTRRLLQLTKCVECKNALLHVENDDSAFMLIRWRQNGGLCFPSNGMIRVCTLAEMVWRTDHSFYLKRRIFQDSMMSLISSELCTL